MRPHKRTVYTYGCNPATAATVMDVLSSKVGFLAMDDKDFISNNAFGQYINKSFFF